ncbi:hypothetical protein Q2T40_01050 [Winogradskyella maritima]|nr:hypothetical protein [Winogradskyella maritima]
MAGNMLGLVSGDETIFGLEFAQYAKADVDLRYYYRWAKEQSLVARVYAGWGIPMATPIPCPL